MIGKILNIFGRGFGRSVSISKHETQNPDITWRELSEKIKESIETKKSFLVSRLGWLESHFIGYYEEHGGLSTSLMEKLWDTPGIFPPTMGEFNNFYQEYIRSMGRIDILGLMRCPYEKEIIGKYIPESENCMLEELEPYYYPIPWSKSLQGKRVLVIHPFSQSISLQFATNRERLFINPDILPEFELNVMPPPQTLCGNSGGFASWSEALNRLKDQVSQREYDVALIGCGSYGLPIGAFIKDMGKVAIHLGGATQILFGIKGGRWDSVPVFKKMMNEHWIRPSEDERPPNWLKAEKGCYW